MGMEPEQLKARVRETFGQAAEAYVASPVHAAGADLQRLLELAAPRPTDRALDVSTGGGHVARVLAPHVASVTATDLTPRMLQAARAFLTSHSIVNAAFVVADAEQLPFLDESFDLVTVRIAPHHYADVRVAVHEMARVLIPGGRLVLIDNIVSADPVIDTLTNEWEKRRDASHVRAYTLAEWQAYIEDVGLTIFHCETGRKPLDFVAWVERVQMPAEERAALERDMLSAPDEVRAHSGMVVRDGRLVSWTMEYVVLRAEKPCRAGASDTHA